MDGSSCILSLRFKLLDSVKLRIGALPQYPSTRSTNAIINEYCELVKRSRTARREVQPLGEREELSLDGVSYEAFNTSGRAWDPL
jgi:hypothetical protein